MMAFLLGSSRELPLLCAMLTLSICVVVTLPSIGIHHAPLMTIPVYHRAATVDCYCLSVIALLLGASVTL